MTPFQEAVFDCKEGKPRKTGLKYVGYMRSEYFRGWDYESTQRILKKRRAR